MISTEDYLYYVDEALTGMISLVESLGDELANQRPDIEGTNTPYVILTHCLGVMEAWAGHLVAGRTIERDRAAEFAASGSVAELATRARRARLQLAEDLRDLDAMAPLRAEPPADVRDKASGGTQGGALLHLYEELAQHRGQMEGCRDVLLAPWARLAVQPKD